MRRGVHGVAGYVVDAVLPIARVRAGQRVRDGHGGAEVAPAHVQVHVLTRVRTADGRQHSAAALPERKETFIGPENFLFFEGLNGKVATYRHMYRAETKEPTQFGSVSGSDIQNLPFPPSGIISLYQSEPKEPT